MTNLENASTESDSRSAFSFRTSWFDCVSSFLMALMIFVSSLVAVLLMLWLFSPSDELVDRLPPVSKTAMGYADATTVKHDFDLPHDSELTDLKEPEFQESLIAVTEAVSLVSGSIAMQQSESRDDLKGSSGDNRIAGDQGNDELVSRAERWQLDFQAKDLKSYAEQLDFFQLELGVIGGSIQGVDYVSSLSKLKLRLKRGMAESEKRLYFLWTQPSPLMNFDRQLIQRSGAVVDGRTMLKFIPSQLEQHLLSLELAYAHSHGIDSVNDIAKTIFNVVRDSSNQPTIVVTAQHARRNGKSEP